MSFNQPTEAAMSDHRFEKPLGADDAYYDIPLESGTIDMDDLRGQSVFHGEKRAREASKRYAIPENAAGAECVDAIAQRILGLLVMSRYRRGPVSFVSDAQPQFLSKIRAAILADRPVELVLSFFGSKVQNALKTFSKNGTEVDVSELASLLRFYEITQAIEAMYPPGAVFHVACDGRKYADAIGFTPEQGRGYYENIALMCRFLGIDHAVRLFDEADHYPHDLDERTQRHHERVRSSYAGGDPAVTRFVTKLRASMCLSMPINTSEIDLCRLRLAFSQCCDDELNRSDPKAFEIRRHLLDQSEKSAIRYIAIYDAVKETGVLERVAPDAIRATVHPKPGQLGIYAVNQHANDVFPHHGQGTIRGSADAVDIEKVRVGFRADLERMGEGIRGVTLAKDHYPFVSENHPFFIETV